MVAVKKSRKGHGVPVAEKIVNDETRVFDQLPVGECVAQGDLYFVPIGRLPTSARPRANRQLAEGTTQGSRHIVTTGDVFDADRTELALMIRKATGETVEEQYVGPVFRSVDRKAYVEHPEHGDHNFQCDVVMAVVFQRSLDVEERARRVLD